MSTLERDRHHIDDFCTGSSEIFRFSSPQLDPSHLQGFLGLLLLWLIGCSHHCILPDYLVISFRGDGVFEEHQLPSGPGIDNRGRFLDCCRPGLLVVDVLEHLAFIETQRSQNGVGLLMVDEDTPFWNDGRVGVIRKVKKFLNCAIVVLLPFQICRISHSLSLFSRR